MLKHSQGEYQTAYSSWPNGSSVYYRSVEICFTPPKKDNFIASVEDISNRAQPGDFILVHFSGHGDRLPTKYVRQKATGAQDEYLCFLDGELADVEFGEMMDDLAARGRTVLVTLDCCFSGGATSAGRNFMVRCRSRSTHLSNSELPRQLGQNQWDQTLPSRGNRNAMIDRESWLYRSREYNVIAPCQPYEEAVEKSTTSGKWGGALTTELIDLLTSWQNRWSLRPTHKYSAVLKLLSKTDGTINNGQ